MYFGTAHRSIAKTNRRLSFEFPPAFPTELGHQAIPLPNGWTLRDDFDIADFPDDFEVHALVPLSLPLTVQCADGMVTVPPPIAGIVCASNASTISH
jgi:hypothetical protein